jgi:hypothetical protein
MTERDVLMAARSDWLVRLLYAFQDPTYVYLAMVRALGPRMRLCVGLAHTQAVGWAARSTSRVATSAPCSAALVRDRDAPLLQSKAD